MTVVAAGGDVLRFLADDVTRKLTRTSGLAAFPTWGHPELDVTLSHPAVLGLKRRGLLAAGPQEAVITARGVAWAQRGQS